MRPVYLLILLTLFLASSLTAQTEADQKILDMADQIEKNVETIRGKPIKRSVEKGIYNREQLREFILENFAKELPDEKLRGWESALKIFGLVPEEMDLKKTLVDFYVSQIGGFYDPETKKLYCISSDITLMQRIVMAHEITHAQQDQYIDMYQYLQDVKHNDDLAVGRLSVLEGEATRMMNIYPQHYPKEMASDLKDLSAADMLSFGLQQFAALQGAPPYFMDSMTFPYTAGEAFVKKAMQMDGWDKIDELYLEPPHSSEQVIHPEKYFGEKDEPVKVCLPDMKTCLGEDYAKIYENTMGEYQVDILLKYTADPIRAMRASVGWDGDTFAVYENRKEGKPLMVWVNTFDTENDATQFLKAQNKAFGNKYAVLEGEADFVDCSLFEKGMEKLGLIEQRGKDILVLDAFPHDLGLLNRARALAWTFSKEEFDFSAPIKTEE